MDILRIVMVHGKELNVYGSKSDPLFLAVDISKMINYSVGNTNHMLNTIDLSEKLLVTIPRAGQKRQMWFVTEYGLYEILMQSRKPIARRFKSAVKDIIKELRLSDKIDFEDLLNYEDPLVSEWEQESKRRELNHHYGSTNQINMPLEDEEISFKDFLRTKGYTNDMLDFED